MVTLSDGWILNIAGGWLSRQCSSQPWGLVGFSDWTVMHGPPPQPRGPAVSGRESGEHLSSYKTRLLAAVLTSHPQTCETHLSKRSSLFPPEAGIQPSPR